MFLEKRKDMNKASEVKFYEDCLDEYLHVFQSSDITRKNWDRQQLDVYIRKTVSNFIIKNEFNFTKGVKKLTKKNLIGKIYEQLGLPYLALGFIYDKLIGELQVDEQGEVKNFILVTVYNDLDQLDLAIEMCDKATDKASLQAEKTKLLDLLAKASGVVERKGGGMNINLGNQAIDNSTNKKTLTSGLTPDQLGQALQNLLPPQIQ